MIIQWVLLGNRFSRCYFLLSAVIYNWLFNSPCFFIILLLSHLLPSLVLPLASSAFCCSRLTDDSQMDGLLLGLSSTVILGSKSCRTRDHILLPHNFGNSALLLWLGLVHFIIYFPARIPGLQCHQQFLDHVCICHPGICVYCDIA
jgi:hypothetical protein